MLLKCFQNGYISGEKCIQLKITILRNLAYALGRKEKYHAAIKMTECVKKLSLKYDYGYKLCIAINDMSWIYRNLYENELQEEYYNIGKQQYRQAYYLALARKDNILAEKLKNGYQRFYQSDIEIVQAISFISTSFSIRVGQGISSYFFEENDNKILSENSVRQSVNINF